MPTTYKKKDGTVVRYSYPRKPYQRKNNPKKRGRKQKSRAWIRHNLGNITDSECDVLKRLMESFIHTARMNEPFVDEEEILQNNDEEDDYSEEEDDSE